MSSANRGRSRNKDDLYETPYWLIEAEIPRIKQILGNIRNPTIWEPCAGNGRITRVLKHFLPNANIISSDIGDFEGLDKPNLDFLSVDWDRAGYYDMIISNPPFFLAQEIIRHAQVVVGLNGSVLMLERLNFFGSKKREPWLSSDLPNSDISPRRASFLPTGQCDSVEYAWLEWQSLIMANNKPKEFAYNRLLSTMTCAGCRKDQFDKACKKCDYAYCKSCYEDHVTDDCLKNLFGKESLWYCYEHPKVPMVNSCRAKGCSLPFCAPCWDEHHNKEGKPKCTDVDSRDTGSGVTSGTQ